MTSKELGNGRPRSSLEPSHSSIVAPNESDNAGGVWNTFKRLRKTPLAVAIVVGFAGFVDAASYGLCVPVLPSILAEMKRTDNTSNGVLYALFSLAMLIAAPVFGIISDRLRTRKYPIAFGLVALALSTVLLIFAKKYWHLVVARLAQGASAGATWAVGLGYVADVYHHSEHGKMMGSVFGANVVGMLAGPPLGGVLFEHGGGRKGPFLLGVALVVVDLIMVLLLADTKYIQRAPLPAAKATASEEDIEEKTPSVKEDTQSVQEQAKSPTENNDATDTRDEDAISPQSEEATPAPPPTDGTEADNKKPPVSMFGLLKDGRVRAGLLSMLIVNGAISTMDVALPIHLEKRFRLSSSAVGGVYAALVISHAIFAPAVGYICDKQLIPNMIIASFGIVGMAIVGLFLAVPYSLAAEIVIMVLVGMIGATSIVPALPELSGRVDALGGGAYSSMFALTNVAVGIGTLVCPIIVTAITDKTKSLLKALGVLAAIMFISVPYIVYFPVKEWLRKRRHQRIGQQGEEEEEEQEQ
ncbi:MFS general substrate transporter [Ramicandelaber brevisporus]|nr:MFS general substrate transporter [Ramicandelaber brevisporus]